MRRNGRVAGPHTYSVDTSRRRLRFFDPVEENQIDLHPPLFTPRTCQCQQGTKRRMWHLAAAVLGALHPGRGGFRGACRLLPLEPRETRACRAARRVALFNGSSRTPASRVGGVGWVKPTRGARLKCVYAWVSPTLRLPLFSRPSSTLR